LLHFYSLVKHWASKFARYTLRTSFNVCHTLCRFHWNAVPLHCQTSTNRWLNLFSLVTCNSCSCCYDSLNLSVSRVKLWTVKLIGPQLRRKEVEFCTAAVGLCRMQDTPVHSFAEKNKVVINDAITASNIYWDSKISQQYCPSTFTSICLIRKTPIFDTATETVTSLVNIKREGKILCYAPFLGPVWCTQSIVLTVKGGLAVTRRYFWMRFVFHAALKWKDAISGFPVSPGSTEALVRPWFHVEIRLF